MKPNKGYFDSFSGLVPCVPVTCFSNVQTRALEARLRITRDHGPYKRGEEIITFAKHFVTTTGPTSCRTIPLFS